MEKKQPDNKEENISKAQAEKQRKAEQAKANGVAAANREALMKAKMDAHLAQAAERAKVAAEERAKNMHKWVLPNEKKAQAKAAKVEAKTAAKQPVVRDAKANKSMAKIRNDSGMKAVGGGGAKKAQEVKQDNSVRFKR